MPPDADTVDVPPPTSPNIDPDTLAKVMQMITPQTTGGTPQGDTSGSGGNAPSGQSFVSLLGEAVGGGESPLYQLSPAQREAAGTRALLNFGVGMLSQSGYRPVRATMGEALASGIQGAEQSMAGSQEAAFTQAGQQQNVQLARVKDALDYLTLQQNQDYRNRDLAVRAAIANQTHTLGLGQLGVSQQDLALKQQQFNLLMQRFKAGQASVDDLVKALTGGGGGTGTGTGTTGAGAGTDGKPVSFDLPNDTLVQLASNPAYKGLPAPDDLSGDMSKFQSPALAGKIVSAALDKGVDPRIALAVAYHETQGNPNAKPGDGGLAIGPFQIHPDAAQYAGFSPDSRYNLDDNVNAGVTLLAKHIAQYGPVAGIVAYRLPTDGQNAQNGKPITPASLQYLSDVVHSVARMPSLAQLLDKNAIPGANAGDQPPPSGGPPAGPATAANLPVPPIPPPGGAPSPSPTVAALLQGQQNADTALGPRAQFAGPGVPQPAPTGAIGGDQPMGAPAGSPGGQGPLVGRPGNVPELPPGSPGANPPSNNMPGFTSTALNLTPQEAAILQAALRQETMKQDGGDVNKVINDFMQRRLEMQKAQWRPATPQDLADRGIQPEPGVIYQLNPLGEMKTVTNPIDPRRVEITKNSLDRFSKDWAEPYDQMSQAMPLLDQMRALRAQVEADPTGGQGGIGAEYARQLQTLLSAAGLSSDKITASIGAQNAYEALANQVALKLRPAGVRTSNFDVGLLLDAVPNLQTTPFGRQIIDSAYRQIYDNFSKVYTAASNRIHSAKNDYTLDGLPDDIKSIGSPVPTFDLPKAGASAADLQAFRAAHPNMQKGMAFQSTDGKYHLYGIRDPQGW